MSESRKVIAIDVDDVLAAENEGMRHFINERYGHAHTPEDYLVEGPWDGYWERIWGVGLEEGGRRYQAYLDAQVSADHALVEGAQEAVNELKLAHDLVIITSRPQVFVDLTHAWLDRHFPRTFRDVEFVSVWNERGKSTKADICHKTGAAYLVDDSLEHCMTAARAGITALLFGDYGWNRGAELPQGVVRCLSWSAVREYFRGVQ